MASLNPHSLICASKSEVSQNQYMLTCTCTCSHTLGLHKFRCTQQSYQAVLPLARRAPYTSARHHSGTLSVFSKHSTQWLLIVLSQSLLFICLGSMSLDQLVASQNHWLVSLPNITTHQTQKWSRISISPKVLEDHIQHIPQLLLLYLNTDHPSVLEQLRCIS